MPIAGSYDVHSFAIDPAGEVGRLDAQVDLFWPQESALYDRLGLRDGMSVLDGGCGTGTVLLNLHARHPGLRSCGIDVDEGLVEHASRRLREASIHGCQISRQSLDGLEFSDGSFDFALSRLVVEHLPDPLPALRQVRRVLAEGGTAVFLANDFDFHLRTSPACPALDDLYEAYRRARRADGGNPCIGRELPGLLRRAGFSEVAVHVLAAHSEVAGDAAFLRAEGAGIPAQLVKSGHLAPETLDRLAREWRAMLAAPEHSMFRMLVAVSGVKRASPDVEGQEAETLRPAGARRPLPETAPQTPTNGEATQNVAALMIEALAREMNVAPEVLDPAMSLIQLGGDSLAAVGLCETLREHLSVSLSVAAVLSEKPLGALAAEVEERMRHR